jgi:hypothetical protein
MSNNMVTMKCTEEKEGVKEIEHCAVFHLTATTKQSCTCTIRLQATAAINPEENKKYQHWKKYSIMMEAGGTRVSQGFSTKPVRIIL